MVEDDAATRDLLERALREELFRVESAVDGVTAEQMAAKGGFDAIVLDVILPGNDGLSVCRRLRTRGIDTPIVLLTGRRDLENRVHGLDAGADDYMAKPFAFEELFARLRAVTRRGRTKSLHSVLSYGPLELDQATHTLKVDGNTVLMTSTELRLVEHFLRRAEEVVTREDLAQHVWGGDIGPQSNVIDVYISYLRRKLAPAGPMIRTIRRAGYVLQKDLN